MVFWIVNILAIVINVCITIAVTSFFQELFHFDLFWITSYTNLYLVKYGLPTLPSVPYHSVPYVVTGAIMFFSVLLSITSPVDAILGYFYGFRHPIRDERDRLHRIFSEVCQKAGKNPDHFKLYITDDPVAHACALGRNTVAITRKLLKYYPNDQIQGVLAHELGHLHYGDSVQLRVYVTVNIVGQIALWSFKICTAIVTGLARIPIPFLNLFLMLVAGAGWITVLLVDLLLMLPLNIGVLFGMRRNEYRSDRYAVEIGQGRGLYDFLYQLLDEDTPQPKGLSLIWQTHPSPGKRIYQLEKLQDREVTIASAMIAARTVADPDR